MNTFIKKYIFLAIFSLFVLLNHGPVNAQTFCFPLDGCTGTSTAPILNSILIGNSTGVYDVKTLTAGTGVTISNSGNTVTFSASSGSFPFTPTTYGGVLVNATSTGLWLTGSPLSLVASSTFASFATSTHATSTTFAVSSLTSALLLTDGSGTLGEYAGTSCTNQFPRSLSALGAATCASVALATDISGTLGVANGGTGITSFATGIATWLGSGTAADLRSLTVGTTGTAGNLVFSISPTLSGVTTDTLDTGQGANELYDMDQNVLTTSNVIFANATNTNATTSTAFFSALGNFTSLCISLDCKTAWPGGLTSHDEWTHPSLGVSATTSDMIFGSASSTVVGGLNITGNATATQATTTYFSVATGIGLMGEYFTNFTTYVRSLFTGGRSISVSGGQFDADAELYTGSVGANLFATTTSSGLATTTEFDLVSVYVPVAITITAFNCYADTTGTSTVRATHTTSPLSAGTDILYTTGTRCGSDVHTATSTFSATAISAGSWIRFYISDGSPTGNPAERVFVGFTATKDD